MRRLILMSLVIFHSCCAGAADKLTVAVSIIEGVLEENSSYPYTTVLNRINESLDTPVVFQFAPSPRAARMLRQHEVLCLFPGSLQHPVNRDKALLESASLVTAKAYVIATAPISVREITSPDAKRLIIGYRSGNSFGGNIEKLSHHTLISVGTNAQLTGLLEKERIDAAIAYVPDILPWLETSQHLSSPLSESSLFYTQNDSFLCHESPESRALITQLDARIKDMRQQQLLKNIFPE